MRSSKRCRLEKYSLVALQDRPCNENFKVKKSADGFLFTAPCLESTGYHHDHAIARAQGIAGDTHGRFVGRCMSPNICIAIPGRRYPVPRL
jgi:hypothetical protein